MQHVIKILLAPKLSRRVFRYCMNSVMDLYIPSLSLYLLSGRILPINPSSKYVILKGERGKTRNYSHEGHREVESLPQASKSDEGLSRKTAGSHLTVGLLILSWWTLAHETTRKPVDTLATVLAHTGYTPV